MSKLSLNGTIGSDPRQSQRLLVEILEQILLLLHPIMPFVTEEIWHVLGTLRTGPRKSVMLESYPRLETGWIDEQTENQMAFLTNTIRAIRNLRAEVNCPPSREVKVVFHEPNHDLLFLREREPYLRALARIGSVEYLTSERPKARRRRLWALSRSISLLVI